MVKGGHLNLAEALRKLTIGPCGALGINKGTLSKRRDADVNILDPEKEYTIDVHKYEPKGKNSPFHGWKVTGQAATVIAGGRVVMRDGVVQ